jgi:hypothetical protein
MDLQIWNFSFQILQFLRDLFLLDFFILGVMVFQCMVVKSYRLSFNSIKRKKNPWWYFFWGNLDCDIGCTILCEVHLELNIYSFDKRNFGFERLECRFQFFISFLPSFSNRFEYNATILNSPKKMSPWFPKRVSVMCFYWGKVGMVRQGGGFS